MSEQERAAVRARLSDSPMCVDECDAEYHCKHGGCEGCDECDQLELDMIEHGEYEVYELYGNCR